MELKKKRTYNRKVGDDEENTQGNTSRRGSVHRNKNTITNKIIEEELGYYNECKDTLKDSKSLFENYHYLSNKEKQNIDNKFSKPKNPSQHRYVRALNNINHKIIIANGPAGTGKTLFAIEYGLKQFLMGKIEKIIFTRPAVTTDEDLGYLPGTLEEKMAPWIRPIYDILYRFIQPSEVSSMLEQKTIEIAPLAYMRGRTFKNTWIVADEMQNSSKSQMKMLMTRLGENSKMVITGDLEQYDRKDEVNGLQDFLEKFRGIRSDSISSIDFDNADIEREQVVKEILNIYGGIVPDTYINSPMTPPDSPVSSICDSTTKSEK